MAQLTRCHPSERPRGQYDDTTRLETFVQRVFQHMNRPTQRQSATVYIRGILATPGKKSINRIASTLGLPDRVRHSLRHLVNDSPWDWEPARAELARSVHDLGEAHAWALVPAFIPKRGAKSPGVHRAFVPTIERTINCQIGMGLFLVGGNGAVPVDWRLVLPHQWVRDDELRRGARVPDDALARPLWAEMLHLADATRALDCPPAPLVAKVCTTSDTTGLIRGLARRRRDFVLTVLERVELPLAASPVRSRGAVDILWSAFLRGHASATGHGGRRLLSTLVRLDDSTPQGGSYRLFAEWPRGATRPVRMWLTNRTELPLGELLDVTSVYQSALLTVQDLQDRFGLLDFEGRTFPGWHHHATLVSAAYCFDRLPARALTPT
ncbi:IS701 family transposase [Nocardiopsis quinghaiensis]|uniref:IS701 family transposase n=1 Tax=Nocardiopsis quinghaiensis TaxID=464995 RepID=UPI001239BCCC|nr:transposase [Nocardiopsis quinghaiensis]